MQTRWLALVLAVPACSPLLGVATTLYEPGPSSSELDHIRSAPLIPNPVTGAVEKRTLGTRIGGDTAIDVTLRSYANDTLCVRFHSDRTSSSDRPSPDNVERSYQLYAPDSLRPPQGTPSIAAARVTPVDFDSRVASTEYDTSGRDKIVATHRYRVDEKFDVCFDHVSRVLRPQSTYALIDFRNTLGDASFQYAWRFDAAPAQTAAR